MIGDPLLAGAPGRTSRRAARLGQGRQSRSFSALVVAAVGAAEIGIGIGALNDRLSIGHATMLHAALLAALLWPTLQTLRLSHADRRLLFAVLAMAVLGPLGAAATVLTGMLTLLFARDASSFDDWYAALFPIEAQSATRMLYEQITRHGGWPAAISSVAPFSDVLAEGSASQKQTVITLIADNFRPEFASTLLRALNDPDAATRVQAATACARIESRFLTEVIALEKARHERPGDGNTVLALARHCDSYARSGLLEPGRAEKARNEALSLYEHFDRLHPGDPDVNRAIGRLLLRLRRYEPAAARLDPDLAGQPVSAPALAWYLESLFHLRRWEVLRDTCRRFRELLLASAELPLELRQAVQMWATEEVTGKSSA